MFGYFVIIFSFLIISNPSKVLSAPVDFGAATGGVAFDPNDNSIKAVTNGNILNDFSGLHDLDYPINSPYIETLLTELLVHGKFSGAAGPDAGLHSIATIVSELLNNTQNAEGATFNDPVLLYGDVGATTAQNLYDIQTNPLIFNRGLVVIRKQFTAPDLNVFIAKAGFQVNNDGLPLMFFEITADDDANAANFVWIDQVIPGEANAGIITNHHLISKDNLVKNAIGTNAGNIELIDAGGIGDYAAKDSFIYSENDKFTESYAKAENAGIKIRKNDIIFKGTTSGEALFSAQGGVIDISTLTDDPENRGSIVIEKGRARGTVAGFARSDQDVSVKTGDIIVDVTALSAPFAGTNADISIVAKNLTIKTHDDTDAELAISFLRGHNVTANLSGEVKIGEYTSFSDNAFLSESTGETNLRIGSIATESINRISENFVKSDGKVTVTVNELNLDSADELYGFDLGDNVAAGQEVIFNFGRVIVTDQTDIYALTRRDNNGKITVNFLEDSTFEGVAAVGTLLWIEGTGESVLNFAANKTLLIKNTKIKSVLVYSYDGDSSFFSKNNSVLKIENVNFDIDNIALVAVEEANRVAKLGNDNSDIYIEGLKVSDDTHTYTSLVAMATDKIHRAEIKARNFSLTNSKIGAVVMDMGQTDDGTGIEIKSTGEMKISGNRFLQSITIGEKQAITISGGDGQVTEISNNILHKGMFTEKDMTFGQTNSSKTVIDSNRAAIDIHEGSLFSSGGALRVLGKEIYISDNIANHAADGLASKELFGARDIIIGDINTEKIVISRNSSGGNNADVSVLSSSNLTFSSKKELNLGINETSWHAFSKPVGVPGTTRLDSEDIYIYGESGTDTTNSKMISVIENNIIIFGNEAKLVSFGLRDLVLKENEKYFFGAIDGFEIKTVENGKVYIEDLKSSDTAGAIDGAIFNITNRSFDVKVGLFAVGSKTTVNNAYLFKRDLIVMEQELSINKIIVDDSVEMAGLYYDKGIGFKLHGYEDDTKFTNIVYKGKVNGAAILKFGSERDRTSVIPYAADAFYIKLSGTNLFTPKELGTKTIAGILFTNPKYIHTNILGNIDNTGGGLKIELDEDSSVDMTMPNSLPSIVVVAHKQNNYSAAFKDRTAYEFGEVGIFGPAPAAGADPTAKVKMSGFSSLKTNGDDRDSFDSLDFVGLNDGDEVGQSKLTVRNLAEFDTGSVNSKYTLHDFEADNVSTIVINLDNSDKNRNLFEWAGDYKTLSGGAAANPDVAKTQGVIDFKGSKIDLRGNHLDGTFTIVQLGKLESKSNDFNSLLKNDNFLEIKKVIAHGAAGLVVEIKPLTGDSLIDSIKGKTSFNDTQAKVLASTIDVSKDVVSGKSSGNSNFDDFSKNFYHFIQDIMYSGNISKEQTKITEVIDNVQAPDSNDSNSGSVGLVGLSSIKSVTNILGDRMTSNVTPNSSADSGMILVADANGSGLYNKSNNDIELFTKINFGFGKLKTSDGNRNINNFGLLVGGDFGLLRNKIKIGTSLMFDTNSLSGNYRNSDIRSLVVSLYSKYDVFELTNKDKLYLYGILNYAHSWGTEKAKVGIFENKSDKNANTVAIDVISGYRFHNIGLTPEFGIGFVYGNQSSYKDNLGQSISSRNNFTMSLKTNIKYDIPMEYLYDFMNISLKFGLSYDVLSTGSKGFNVKNPVGLEYYVSDSEGIDKLNFNYGINISYDLDKTSKVSFSYNGTVTKNLFNNGFSLEYRYKIR